MTLKKSVKIKRIVFFTLTALWMVAIFLFSAQNGSLSSKTSGGVIQWLLKLFYSDFDSLSIAEKEELIVSWQFFVRKAAHFSAYALLGVLSTLAFDTFKLKRIMYYVLPAVLSVCYAALDEFHQTFVPDRVGCVTDVLIDFAGAAMGISFVGLVLYLWRRQKAKKSCK